MTIADDQTEAAEAAAIIAENPECNIAGQAAA
jgi:hypothetical protein